MCVQGRPERVRAPVKKIPVSPSKGGLTKNRYTKSVRLTLSCRVLGLDDDEIVVIYLLSESIIAEFDIQRTVRRDIFL